MSDTPTTAERLYIVVDRSAVFDLILSDPEPRATAVEQARTCYADDDGNPADLFLLVPCDDDGDPSPGALADLNGGEWVQPTLEGINTYQPWVNPLDGGTHWVPVDDDPPPGWLPLCYFVPREDR